jgi:hypothetical protein
VRSTVWLRFDSRIGTCSRRPRCGSARCGNNPYGVRRPRPVVEDSTLGNANSRYRPVI